MLDVFKLTHSLLAVTFNAEGRGSLSTLPAGARLTLTGDTRSPGLVEVTNGLRLFSIFAIDLRKRSVTVRKVAAAA